MPEITPENTPRDAFEKALIDAFSDDPRVTARWEEDAEYHRILVRLTIRTEDGAKFLYEDEIAGGMLEDALTELRSQFPRGVDGDPDAEAMMVIADYIRLKTPPKKYWAVTDVGWSVIREMRHRLYREFE